MASAQERNLKGTTQLAGDNGKLGVEYTIGKGNAAINIKLRSVEYSINRRIDGDLVDWPNATDKFLVLHFNLHNPNHFQVFASSTALKFTAVDSNNVNHAGNLVFQKEGTHETIQMNLMPGQDVAFVTLLLIPSDASIPKLIVERGEGAHVLRYIFKAGDIKPLAAAVADPADPSGATPLKILPAASGEYVQARNYWDIKLVSSSYAAAIGTAKAGEGKQWFIASVMVKNCGPNAGLLNGFSFNESVKTDDGEKTGWGSFDLFKTARDESVDQKLDAAEEYTIRVIIPIPDNVKVTELNMRGGDVCRPVVFKITP